MATTLTIGGSSVAVPRALVIGKCVVYTTGGIPTLSLFARGGALPTLPDPYLGKSVSLSVNGTVRFTGDVVSMTPTYDEHLGWVRAYQCLGLRHRGDKVPLTDSTSLIDSSQFNLQIEDQSYNPARAGRTVGQILTAVLTMVANATALNAYGLGAYTSLSPPTLPSSTTTDLAALTLIPPSSIYVQGEKILGAVEAFLSEWAPNHTLWIDPATGALRVLDRRSFSGRTLTMGTDPIHPTELTRDVADCFQRVTVRGQPIAVMGLLKTSESSLLEDFAHDGLTIAQAKAAWKPSDWKGTTHYQDSGTCTNPSTTTVAVTSSDPTVTWTSNYWDQTSTGNKGTINLVNTIATGISTLWTARIVSNTALSAGGTSTLTIDAPLPNLNYNHYTISGYANGASLVWTRYKIADTSLWPLVVNQSTYPQPFHAGGGGVSLVSTASGMVLWSQSGSGAPYNMSPVPFVYDGSGHLYFAQPTYFPAQFKAPSDVWALIPFNAGSNLVHSPQDSSGSPVYAGTSHSVENLSDTLTVTCPEWRDPAQVTAMQAYADDLLDTVKDARVEGVVTYLGLYEDALAMGIALSISANGYTVPYGWATAALPVVECELEFGGNLLHVTRMRCSNRREHYSAGQFMHPDRTGITWGPPEGSDPLVLGGATYAGNAFDAALSLQSSLAPDNSGANVPTNLDQAGVDITGGFRQQNLKDFGVPTNLNEAGVDITGGAFDGGNGAGAGNEPQGGGA